VTQIPKARRGSIAVCLAAAAVGLAPASATAATQIGETFIPPSSSTCQPGFTQLQVQYTAPFDGVITAWSYQAAASPPDLKLKVAHPAGGGAFTIVGESGVKDPAPHVLSTYTDVGVPIQAGDLIGFALTDDGECNRASATHSTLVRAEDVPVGQTRAFSPSGGQLDISAALEPDCDSDGLGDETQDPSLLGGTCPLRGRTLTLDANKNKVKKGKKVTLSGQVTEFLRQGECQATQTVELQRKRPSQSSFTTVEQLQTDAAGAFSTKERVKKTFEYRAQVAETATCTAGLSNTEKVKAKKPK
jgi:hypothetical protein